MPDFDGTGASRSGADDSRTSESAMSARRLAEVVALFEGGLLDAGYDELRDPIAAPNRERFCTEIHEDNTDMAPEI